MGMSGVVGDQVKTRGYSKHMAYKPEEIMAQILNEPHLNVFDVFAILFLYCDPRFNAILDDIQGEYPRIERIADQLANSVLPRHNLALDELDAGARKMIVSALEGLSNERFFAPKCFSLVRAIDIAYAELVLNHIEQFHRFSAIPMHLNLNHELGLVFLKPISSLVPPIKDDQVTYRSGTEKETNIRDYLDNFLCLKVPEGYELDFQSLDFSIWQCFPKDPSALKIALIPLVDTTDQFIFDISGTDPKGNNLYRVLGLKDVVNVTDLALGGLKTANEEGAAVVIFPEFCIPPEIRDAIATGLRSRRFPSVKMVIAGSFHEKIGDRWHNIAHVLDAEGNEIWQQRKYEPNTIMKYQLKNYPSLATYASSNLKENIATSPRKIFVRETPIGRMVVVICSDLLLEDSWHRKLFKDIRVNLIIVPAMTAVLEPDFINAAEEFAEHCQALTIVSNACCLPRETKSLRGKDIKISMAYYPPNPSKWWRCCNTMPGSCSYYNCLRDFILSLAGHPSGFE